MATSTALSPTRMVGMPHQLELELVTIGSQPTAHNTPCGVALGTTTHPRTIPGLDADLCRCPACTDRAEGGIWWFNSAMRESILKRRTAFRFRLDGGDLARDEAAA